MTYIPEAAGWRVTNEDIQRLCSYISSDKTIADYTGERLDRIAGVRASMPQRRNREYSFGSGNESVSNEGQRMFEQSTRMASEALRTAMFRYYEQVASERGLPNEWQAAVVLGMAA